MKILRMVRDVKRTLVFRPEEEELNNAIIPKTVYVIQRVPLRLKVCNKVKTVIQMRTFFARSTSVYLNLRILESILSTRPRILTPLMAEITEAVKPSLCSVASSQSFCLRMYGPEPVPERYDSTAEKMRGARNLR